MVLVKDAFQIMSINMIYVNYYGWQNIKLKWNFQYACFLTKLVQNHRGLVFFVCMQSLDFPSSLTKEVVIESLVL